MGLVQTHTTADTLLAALDALDLRAGSWFVTDADGTLWAADVADEAWQRLHAERLLRPAAAHALSRILGAAGGAPTGEPHADGAALYQMYLDEQVDDWPVLEAMTVCFSGWREEEVRSFGGAVFRDSVASRTFETTATLLDAVLARGHRLAVVSGSPRLIVEAALAGLGLDPLPLVCGMDLRQEDGLLTDEVVHPMTWGAGKVQALRAVCGDEPIEVAFGDTAGDLELLEAARSLRVLVHPRPGLVRAAEESTGPWCLLVPQRTVGGHLVETPDSDRVIQQGCD